MEQVKPATPREHVEEASLPQVIGSQNEPSPIGPTLAQQHNAGRLLSIKQVAELLQVPQSWVYGQTRARGRDRLPGLRLGKYWRFWEADVVAWLETKKS